MFLIDKIKSFLYQTDKNKETLLNNLYSSVLLAEKDYNDVLNNMKKSISKEEILNTLIELTYNLIISRFGNKNIDVNFNKLLTLLKVNSIYITKLNNKKFEAIYEWKSDIETTSYVDFYDFIELYNNNYDFHKCYVNGNKRICVFPIIINGEIWGTFNLSKYVSYKDKPKKCMYCDENKCYWNIDQVHICTILTSIIASHLKNYKLFDNLNQSIKINETIVNMTNMYAWAKDEFGRYLFCSTKWKNDIFNLDDSVDVVGKTENELFENSNLDDIYKKICKLSDIYCMKLNKKCYFLEAAYINKEHTIFTIIKSPIIVNNIIIGIAGRAKKLNIKYNKFKKIITTYINKDDIEKINKENDIFSYYIRDKSTFIEIANQKW